MTPFPPPEPESVRADVGAPAAASRPMLSRRLLLAGAAGTVVAVAGGLAVVYTSGNRGQAPFAAPQPTAPGTSPAALPPETSAAPSTAPATTTPATTPPPVTSNRVLVVLQLGGGNDALNTLVPVAGSYHDARPTLALADDALMALAPAVSGSAGYGLHPALGPLSDLISSGQVGVVAGIGFAEPDRSHFEALDMWWSAAPGQTFRTGWLGRWLDATLTADDSVLRSVGLGGTVPAMRADEARSIGVNEPAQFTLARSGASTALIGAWSQLSADHAAARTATDTFAGFSVPGDVSATAVATGRLLTAAQLIAADPGVRVVHVAVSGFDTHSGQLAQHEQLLADVADGIARFQLALEASGDAERVLLITTSEFGRRVAENGSGGTDHGKAGVQFVVGRGLVAPSVFGVIDPTDLVDGDLRAVVDPRSLYATALDWLGDAALTDQVLGAPFERLPFLR